MSEQDKIFALQRELDSAQARLRKLEGACYATLLFHSGSPWTEDKQARWLAITQYDKPGVTTKALCDFIRAVLREPPQ